MTANWRAIAVSWHCGGSPWALKICANTSRLNLKRDITLLASFFSEPDGLSF